MAIEREVLANKKEALELLKSLRSSEDVSYKEVLNRMMQCFGCSFATSSEEVAKGILIALITKRYGYDYRRDITLNALNLLADFNELKVTRRREEYIKAKDQDLTTDAIRKKEDIFLSSIVDELAMGINEEGEAYLDGLFSSARRFFYLYFSQLENDWRVRLPGLHDGADPKRAGIGKKKIQLAPMEERIADELHQRIVDGEKKINTRFLLNTGQNYIGELYAYKYHDYYDLILLINIDHYDEKDNIFIGIENVVGEDLMTIMLPVEWAELKMLIDSFRRPLFNYTFESDGTPDDREILRYLENKGVVFYPEK